MSKWLIVGLMAAQGLPCWAAKRLTVAQLEERVTAGVAAHKADAELARQIGQSELSERISAETLKQLDQRVAREPHARLALKLLADVSSFLPLPASELPVIAAPDQSMQQRQLEAARDYAFRMLARLPNLLATRTTYSFDDSPQEEEKGAWLQRAGLHQVGSSSAEVSVLSEREKNLLVKESSSSGVQKGLVTWGEFGSTLLLVVNDTANGTIHWSHWEQSQGGPISVFDYSVSKSASHYQVATPTERTKHSGGSGRWWSDGGNSSDGATSAMSVARSNAAYRGSLWIDPSSGTILRVSLVVDLKGNPVLENGAILVEYGPVRIDNQTFICPLRSLALSSAPGSVNATLNGTATEWLNENVFAGYHLFGSTSRILTEQADSSREQMPAFLGEPEASSWHPEEEASDTKQVPATPPPPAAPETPAAESTVHAPDVAVAAPAPVVPAAAVPAPSTPSTSSIATAVAPTLEPRAPDADAPATPTFRINTNSVLVPVIVRDGHGSSVDDLGKADFAVFDDGKPRTLSGFLIEKRGSGQDAKGGSPGESANASGVMHSQPSLPSRITVFAFDDMDMGPEDIQRARLAVSKVFEEALNGSDMAAVVTTSGKVNSGITRDRSALDKALVSIRPVVIYRSDATDCPQISYYQADQIVNKHSDPALQDVIGQIRTVCIPKAPLDLATSMAQEAARHALNLGMQGTRATYGAISEYVRRMKGMPGQRTMVVVSSGLLPIDQEGRYEESALMNLAADCEVTIDAIDASGLHATAMMASDDTRERDPNLLTDMRDNEKRVAENALGELAYATGGDFFHNNNDLESGFKELLNAPETVYVLEFAIDGVKANGAYHRLKVSVDRGDVRVQARKGYVAPRQERKKK
jgi:VWFA-related protein